MKELEIHRISLGGCGNRIHAFLGVLLELEHVIKKSCHHFIGASAGSIIATLLALKCSVNDILEQEKKHPFHIAWSWIFPAIWRMICYQDGLIPIEYIQQHIRSVLIEMIFVTWDYSREEVQELIDTRLTFRWLHDHLHNTLEIQAMDRNRAEHFIFNHKRTPDVLILDAITASCAIPWAFSRFVFRDKVLCDAAVFSGLPWASIQCDQYLPVQDVKTGKYLTDPVTVGVCLSEEASPQSTTSSDGAAETTKDDTDASWFHWIKESVTGICTNHVLAKESLQSLSDPKTSISHPCIELFSLPIRMLHNHEKTIGSSQDYIIHVHVDPNIYGSKLHSLWPTASEKQGLLKQGIQDAQLWLSNRK